MKKYFLFITFLSSLYICGQVAVADSLQAVGNYQAAIEIYKKDGTSHFKLARVYSQLGNVNDAINSYEKGFMTDSSSVLPRFEYGRLVLNSNDPVGAFDTFSQLSREFPENAAYQFYMAKTFEDLGRDDDAVSAFAKALSLNSSYRAARVEMVKMLIKKRKFHEAILSAKPGLELYQNDIKLNSLIAQAYLGAKRYDMAIEHFELLFELGNDTEYNRKNLAFAYFNDGQWQLALDNYDIYNVDYEDTNSLINYMMSQAYLKLGKLDAAQDYIERSILFKTPELYLEYLHFASVYVKKEDYKNAFYATKKAKSELPDNDTIGYQYTLAADYYFADKSEKLKYYEQFVKEYPNSNYIEIANARITDLRKEIFIADKK